MFLADVTGTVADIGSGVLDIKAAAVLLDRTGSGTAWTVFCVVA